MPIAYAHAPEPGVANARNVGVAASRGRFIAFLDDDEEAPEGWLAALCAAQKTFDADAVFGPVRARLPETIERHRTYFEGFFSRIGPDVALHHPVRPRMRVQPGAARGLARRGSRSRPPAMAPAGEDDLLFAQMKGLGARFAWAPDAWVWEDPEPARLTLDYTLEAGLRLRTGA